MLVLRQQYLASCQIYADASGVMQNSAHHKVSRKVIHLGPGFLSNTDPIGKCLIDDVT